MTGTKEKSCACGLPMLDNGRGAYFCDNCDQVQPQESEFGRRKTTQDIRYQMYWVREEEKYKDNTVGTPNNEPEGGTTNE